MSPPVRWKPSTTSGTKAICYWFPVGAIFKIIILILIRCSFLKQKCKTVASRDTVYEAKDVPGVFLGSSLFSGSSRAARLSCRDQVRPCIHDRKRPLGAIRGLG